MERINIDDSISSLAYLLRNDQVAFEKLAKEIAANLNIGDLPYLKNMLHEPPKLCEKLKDTKMALGEWLAMCQYAIFELLYNCYDYSLPIIKEIAYGPYDWTQATSLEVLCRLNVEEKISDSILDEINEKLKGMRYETHLYFSRALLLRAEDNKKYDDILRRFNNQTFREALIEIHEELFSDNF